MKAEFTRRKIAVSARCSDKRKAWLLLHHMAEGLEMPTAPGPVINFVGPTDDMLADEAVLLCWEKIMDLDDVPPAYNCATVRDKWLPRRLVSVGGLGVCVSRNMPCTHTCTHTHMHTHTCIHTSIYTHAYTHAYTHIYIFTRGCMSAYIYIYA